MNFIDTLEDSLLENFFPAGWDMARIDACCSYTPEELLKRQSYWDKDFLPVQCEDVSDFNMMMGHEIALEVRRT